MLEPPPAARIVRVDAPAQAVAGTIITISVAVRYDVSGVYYIYLIDVDTGEILASGVERILQPGETTMSFDIIMLPRDLRCRIELHSEPRIIVPF